MGKIVQFRRDALDTVAKRVFYSPVPITQAEAQSMARAVKQETRKNRNG